jgi:DNA primase
MANARLVFDDVIVSATTLNRRSGEVLDQAWEKCVTIMRNEQSFALLRREQAAGMIAQLHRAQQILDLFHAIERVRSGASLDPADEFEWLRAFALDDLKEMGDEVYAAYTRSQRGEIPPEEADAVMHEWQESAWAARSPNVGMAFEAAADEVPLTEPIPAATAHE